MVTSTDPIADMLTRIRNAIAVGKQQLEVPYSNAKERLAKILVSNGFLESAVASGKGKEKVLTISLYGQGGTSTITEVSRVSKPGRRIYVKAKDIPTVKRGRGIVVVSTSQGVMTGEEAKKKKLGGELICEVY